MLVGGLPSHPTHTPAHTVTHSHFLQDYDGNPVDVREHEDASEFFTRLQVTWFAWFTSLQMACVWNESVS
jgi:hypothetical protein